MRPEPATAGPTPARHTWVMTRHTLVLLLRDPGTPLAYTVMSLVLLSVLHPVYDRLATPGTSGIVQAAPGIAVMFTLLALDVSQASSCSPNAPGTPGTACARARRPPRPSW